MAESLFVRADEVIRLLGGSKSEALEIAKAYQGDSYVLLNEASDNPGGGAPGDSTICFGRCFGKTCPAACSALFSIRKRPGKLPQQARATR